MKEEETAQAKASRKSAQFTLTSPDVHLPPGASALLSHNVSVGPLQQPHPETKSLAKLMAHSPGKRVGSVNKPALASWCFPDSTLHTALCPTDLFLSTSGVSGVKTMVCSGASPPYFTS